MRYFLLQVSPFLKSYRVGQVLPKMVAQCILLTGTPPEAAFLEQLGFSSDVWGFLADLLKGHWPHLHFNTDSILMWSCCTNPLHAHTPVIFGGLDDANISRLSRFNHSFISCHYTGT